MKNFSGDIYINDLSERDLLPVASWTVARFFKPLFSKVELVIHCIDRF